MRKSWLDYLRLIAVIAVIAGHVTVDFYREYSEIEPSVWWLSNILCTLASSAVGLFVMISGALLLGRKYSVGEFYKKRAVRLFPAIIFWNLAYLGYYAATGMDTQTISWVLRAQMFADGYTAPHLWFLTMLVCLMLFTPFINQFINGEKPTYTDISILLGVILVFFFLDMVSRISVNIFNLPMEWYKIFVWYIAYFVCGYYIDRYGANITIRKHTVFLFFIILTVSNLLLGYYAFSKLGIVSEYFVLGGTGPLVFLTTGSIFLLAQKSQSLLRENRIIVIIAEASFGVYLIHEIYDSILVRALPGFYENPLVFLPIVILGTTILSISSIVLLRRIPFFRAVT